MNTLSILLISAELEKRLSNDTIMKISNFTKCQLTADKVLRIAEDVDKYWEKMRICYNVTESVNNMPYRQSISYSESTSLLAKRLMKGNFIEAGACEGQFHQSRGLQRAISSKQRLATVKSL